MTLEELLAREGVDGEAVVAWARERVQAILDTLPPQSELGQLLGATHGGAQSKDENTLVHGPTVQEAVHTEEHRVTNDLGEVEDSEEIEVLDAADVELLDVDPIEDEETVADARRVLKDNHG